MENQTSITIEEQTRFTDIMEQMNVSDWTAMDFGLELDPTLSCEITATLTQQGTGESSTNDSFSYDESLQQASAQSFTYGEDLMPQNPTYHTTIATQMRELQEELSRIREEYVNNRQVQDNTD